MKHLSWTIDFAITNLISRAIWTISILMKDYYSVLGVSKDADEVVIRAAYKALAQKYHPDKASPELRLKYTDLMQEINEAYSVIGNSIQRSNQDNPSKNYANPESDEKRVTQEHDQLYQYSTYDKKELPRWVFNLILFAVSIFCYYLIFKFFILKH